MLCKTHHSSVMQISCEEVSLFLGVRKQSQTERSLTSDGYLTGKAGPLREVMPWLVLGQGKPVAIPGFLFCLLITGLMPGYH